LACSSLSSSTRSSSALSTGSWTTCSASSRPDPIPRVIRAVLIIVIVLVVISVLLGFVGYEPVMPRWRYP